MPPLNATSQNNARATYTVDSRLVSHAVCHREGETGLEFLIRWKSVNSNPSRAALSWHDLSELWHALHHIQNYVELHRSSGHIEVSSAGLPISRKRKTPNDGFGLLTPGSSLGRSRSPSVATIDLTASREKSKHSDSRTYNVILQRKAGRITARTPRLSDNFKWTDTRHMPTPDMRQAASDVALDEAEVAIRSKFLEMLRPVKNVFLENNLDSTTPSLDFQFIDEYRFQDGICKPDPDGFEGCTSCRPNMGQNIGCEYPQKCECLEFAAVDEAKLERQDPELFHAYQAAVESGQFIETKGLPKRFPYKKPSKTHPHAPQTLLEYYLKERHPIYECNVNCRCGDRCKSRLVQKGRSVPLTIFKTPNRGWGVKCNEELIRGEFIDTYLGEIITDPEADRREGTPGSLKSSYLYGLDKWADEMGPNECYVVDGQHMGGPTRFINHSCEPNCRQYTVSHNKYDKRIYSLAFFAYEDIPEGTELTFDYQDLDEVELEEAIRIRQKAEQDPENRGRARCNCGAEKCRGFLW